MNRMLAVRDFLNRFYGKYDTAVLLVFKFAVALWAFMEIYTGMDGGASSRGLLVIFALALACALLPSNGMVIIGAGIIAFCLFNVSLEAMIVGGGILLTGLMLYFSIAPSSAYPLILTALFVKMRLGFIPAVIFGLIGGPLSAVGIAFGSVLHSLLQVIVEADGNLQPVSGEAAEAMVQKMAGLIRAVIQEKEMLVMSAVLVMVMLIVYGIRIMKIKYAWVAAAVTGAAGYLLLRLAGWAWMYLETDPAALVIEVTGGLLLAAGAQFLLMGLDYKKTESVRFEDDEYYYFVKAVPKKKIRRKRRRRRSEGR